LLHECFQKEERMNPLWRYPIVSVRGTYDVYSFNGKVNDRYQHVLRIEEDGTLIAQHDSGVSFPIVNVYDMMCATAVEGEPSKSYHGGNLPIFGCSIFVSSIVQCAEGAYNIIVVTRDDPTFWLYVCFKKRV
jgi:hypothetical protein